MTSEHGQRTLRSCSPVESLFMATRTIASRIDALVEQMAELVELASQVQASDDDELALQLAKQLDQSYQAWYKQSLAVLPDDLREGFRFEFLGDWRRNRIKHFLNEPRKPSVAYASYTEDFIRTFSPSIWQYPFGDVFRGPFTSQKSILLEARARYGLNSEMLEALEQLDHICRRLPIAFAIMGRKVQNRTGLKVADEYDVQRILHAICATIFEEVEDEDPTPKMAAGSSRLDFLLRRERVAVETKMLGDNLTLPKLRDDLSKDIVYFRAHQNAGSLFIFAYDPGRKILSPAGFEAAFHSDSDDFPVRIVVAS